MTGAYGGQQDASGRSGASELGDAVGLVRLLVTDLRHAALVRTVISAGSGGHVAAEPARRGGLPVRPGDAEAAQRLGSALHDLEARVSAAEAEAEEVSALLVREKVAVGDLEEAAAELKALRGEVLGGAGE